MFLIYDFALFNFNHSFRFVGYILLLSTLNMMIQNLCYNNVILYSKEKKLHEIQIFWFSPFKNDL